MAFTLIANEPWLLQVEILHLVVRGGKKPTWTEEEEEELRKLYEEHRHSEGLLCFCLLQFHTIDSGLDAFIDCWFLCLEPDIVEALLPLLSNNTRTRRQVVTQLVHMGLVDNAKELKKQKYVFQTG